MTGVVEVPLDVGNVADSVKACKRLVNAVKVDGKEDKDCTFKDRLFSTSELGNVTFNVMPPLPNTLVDNGCPDVPCTVEVGAVGVVVPVEPPDVPPDVPPVEPDDPELLEAADTPKVTGKL